MCYICIICVLRARAYDLEEQVRACGQRLAREIDVQLIQTIIMRWFVVLVKISPFLIVKKRS